MGADWLMGSKGGYSIDPYGQLNPEQKNMFQSIAPQINARAISGAPTYTGEYNSPYTDIENQNMQRQSRLSAMGEGWANQFQPGQLNPEVENTEYQALAKKFYGDGIDPGALALANEQYAGSGGYWGNARANAAINTYGKTVTDPYATGRSTRLQNSYANALGYTSAMNALRESTQKLAEVPRLIKDYGLDKQYNEWVRGQNMSKEYVDQALQFISIPTKSAEYKAGKQGMIGTLGSAAGGIIGNMIAPGIGGMVGSQLGGSIAGSFDKSGVSGSSMSDSMGTAFMLNKLYAGGSPYSYTGSGTDYGLNTGSSWENNWDLQSRLNALNGKPGGL